MTLKFQTRTKKAPPNTKLYVFQDGPDFYIETKDEKLIGVLSAPHIVPDFDIERAEIAREWFEERAKLLQLNYEWRDEP